MDVVSLKAAARDDMQTIWEMQIEAFSELLDKYRDYDISPGVPSHSCVPRTIRIPFSSIRVQIFANRPHSFP